MTVPERKLYVSIYNQKMVWCTLRRALLPRGPGVSACLGCTVWWDFKTHTALSVGSTACANLDLESLSQVQPLISFFLLNVFIHHTLNFAYNIHFKKCVFHYEWTNHFVFIKPFKSCWLQYILHIREQQVALSLRPNCMKHVLSILNLIINVKCFMNKIKCLGVVLRDSRFKCEVSIVPQWDVLGHILWHWQLSASYKVSAGSSDNVRSS